MTIFKKVQVLMGHKEFQKYASNTSWLFVERIIRISTMFLTGVYMVRYLGPQRFGELSYAQSFVALFAPIANLGLDGVVILRLVSHPEASKRVLGAAFWLKFGGAIISIFLMMAVSMLIENTNEENLFIFILGLGLLCQSTNIFDLYYQSITESRRIALIQLAQTIFSASIKMSLVFTGAPLLYFVISFLFDGLLLATGFIWLSCKRGLSDVYQFFTKIEAINMIKQAWPLIFSGIAIVIYMRIDQVMLRLMVGNDAVGEFSAALKVSEACYFIPLAICSSIFPAIIEAKNKDFELYMHRLEHLYRVMILISIIIAIPVSLLSEHIIEILYGPSYKGSALVLQIHVWTAPFVFLGIAMSNWLVLEGMAKKSLYRTLLGMVVNVVANIILIPRFGIVGAAIATLLGQITSNILYDFFDPDVKKQLNIKLNAFNVARYIFYKH